MEKFKDERDFTNGEYLCHSPEQHRYLQYMGIPKKEEKQVVWSVAEQIKFRERRGKPVEGVDIQDKLRTRWIYEGTKELSDALKFWSENNPNKNKK